MDHSIEAYLRRRSTEELKAILVYCLNDWKNYGYAVAIILRILNSHAAEEERK